MALQQGLIKCHSMTNPWGNIVQQAFIQLVGLVLQTANPNKALRREEKVKSWAKTATSTHLFSFFYEMFLNVFLRNHLRDLQKLLVLQTPNSAASREEWAHPPSLCRAWRDGDLGNGSRPSPGTTRPSTPESTGTPGKTGQWGARQQKAETLVWMASHGTSRVAHISIGKVLKCIKSCNTSTK